MNDTPIRNSARPWEADMVVWQEMVSGDKFANVPTPHGYVSLELNHTAQTLHLQFAHAGLVHVRRYNDVKYSQAYSIALARRFAAEVIAKVNVTTNP